MEYQFRVNKKWMIFTLKWLCLKNFFWYFLICGNEVVTKMAKIIFPCQWLHVLIFLKIILFSEYWIRRTNFCVSIVNAYCQFSQHQFYANILALMTVQANLNLRNSIFFFLKSSHVWFKKYLCTDNVFCEFASWNLS